MQVHVVDPAAFTPPYDRALCRALAAQGVDVTLVTAPFRHGEVAAAEGYGVLEHFGRARQEPARMLRYALGPARRADLLHVQWFPLPELDTFIRPRRRPLVLTAHDVLPRQPRRGQLQATRKLLQAADAVVVHSEHGAARLRDEVGLAADRVHVIPHGVLDQLAAVDPVLPEELPAGGPPVVLAFGLLRPYKGLDVLLEAWEEVTADAELWVVGAPRMALPDFGRRTRTVLRFVSDAEAAAVLRRAALVVCPYREIDQSGVLYSALALGKALVLSDAGGFAEVDAAAHVPAGDAGALAAELQRLLEDESARRVLQERALAAAAGPYAWDPIARRHRELYLTLT